MRDEAVWFPFSLTIRDHYGDLGLVNVVIVRRGGAVLEIELFLMSCRVLQRGVEQFAMNRIFEFARGHGHTRVIGRYIPTAKNAMVKEFYKQFGFACVAASDAGSEWSLDVEDYVPRQVFIREFPASENPDPVLLSP
jgi:FkbH-like protein